MQQERLDDLDGLPVWAFAAADEILDGLLAIEPLGVGQRCETWLAWSRDLWHPVVAKLARPHQRDHPRAARSLGREAAALCGVLHPLLPRLLRDGTADELPHLVMEYVDGPTLAELVDEGGPLAPPDVARLGAQLLPVVSALHDHGLAHLDVKSENVVVRDGRPVLIDFGSARALGRAQPHGLPVGTFGYAAPEMEECQPISAQMDLFGIGTVLTEALTGAPFPDRAPLPDGPVSELARRLTAHSPSTRGTAQQALLCLATACEGHRLWPGWADRLLEATGSG